MEDYNANIIANVKEYIKSFTGVKDYHVSLQRAITTTWHVRDSLLIRLWVDKDLFEANSVMAALTEGETFEDEIKTLVKGVLVPKFDIYYT